MGKIRVAKLGDEKAEKEQHRKADARREAKKAKKQKVEGVGLKGGERVAVMEETEIKPEFKKLVEEVEKGNEVKESPQKKRKARVRSKRYQEIAALVEKNRFYPLTEAIELLKKTSMTKFDGTVEIHVNLNKSSLGGKNDLRGSVSLPHGTGKKITVAIADEKIIADIAAGKIEFDILVAHPSMMSKLAKVARVLGPKGLMPNPKTGTVTENPENRVKELSSGQVNFKTEPDQPVIHMSVGKVSFEGKKLEENIEAVLTAVGRNKILSATLSSTMGPGIKLAIS